MKNKGYKRSVRLTLEMAALVIGLLYACASDNELSGSLEEVYRLQFDLVRARLYSSEFALEYLVSKSGVVPVRLTLNRKSLNKDKKELKSGESYDLNRYGDITGRQADGTEIFRFSSGTLHLDAFDTAQDSEVSGSFDAKFRAGDDSFTLSGDFLTELEVVPEPNIP
ncbi:MAG: hypothetical protein JXA30_22835 [Deltaproteobacteria bacterium]|nr:hypothetical protein [Deltaproteobacteria bacterium]